MAQSYRFLIFLGFLRNPEDLHEANKVFLFSWETAEVKSIVFLNATAVLTITQIVLLCLSLGAGWDAEFFCTGIQNIYGESCLGLSEISSSENPRWRWCGSRRMKLPGAHSTLWFPFPHPHCEFLRLPWRNSITILSSSVRESSYKCSFVKPPSPSILECNSECLDLV